MISHDDLVTSIYEAALVPERWPALLETLVDRFGGQRGTLGQQFAGGRQSSPASRSDARWSGRTSRPIADPNDFGVDPAERTKPRMSIAVYRDGLKAVHATAASEPEDQDERLVLTIEGFADRSALEDAAHALEQLRPHLARSARMAIELQMRECRSMIDGFDRIGAGAAIISDQARVIAANDTFQTLLGDFVADQRDRLRLAHRPSDDRLMAMLTTVARTGRCGSVALRDDLRGGFAALHLVPTARAAQEMLLGAHVIALVTRPSEEAGPSPQLIQALFDLTPAEADVARSIAAGDSIETIARQTGKATETVRSHLERIYSKTATGRQNELAVLLYGFSTAGRLTA